jgi:hypothetical protein
MRNSVANSVCRCFVTILSFAVIGPAAAWAQDSTFASGGLLFSSQGAGDETCESSGCARPPISGSSWGITAEVGHFVAQNVSVAFAVDVPSRFESFQTTAIPNVRSDNLHRETSLSGLLGVHTPRFGAVRLAVIGGGGLLQESTDYREAVAPFQSSAYGPYGPTISVSRWTFEVIAGGDAEFIVAPHVSIVPRLTVHLVDREAPGDGRSGLFRLGTVVWRTAFSVRARF